MSIHRQWSIILGYPRSGTTFLVEALAGADYRPALSRGYPSQIAAIWDAGLTDDVLQAIRYSFAFALEDYVQAAEESRAAAVSECLQGSIGLIELVIGLLRRRRLQGLIYKEPFLAFAPELPYTALPNARIVHIYRDCRDSADSLVRRYDPLTDSHLTHLGSNELTFGRRWDDRYVPWWVETGRDEEFIRASPFIRAVWMWRFLTRRAHEFARSPEIAASGRVLEVQYELLVTNPVEEGRRVLAHLGIDSNRRIERRLRAAHDRSIGVYNRRDPIEIEGATRLAESELLMMGYSL